MSDEDTKLIKIKLQSKDGKTLTIDYDTAMKSKFLEGMISNTNGTFDEALQVEDFSYKTISKVFDWCRKNAKKSGRAKNEDDPRIVLTKDELEYLNMPNKDLVKVVLCANYFDISELMEIITQRVADMISGKSVVTMRKILKLEDDLTEEEKAEIRKKHEWCNIR